MDEQVKNLYALDPEFRPTRLVSLFSDYKHLEESNNEGFKANTQAWKRIVLKLIEEEQLLVLDYHQLQKKLTYVSNTGEYVPQGLYIVLEELVKEGRLEFVKPKGVVGYFRWLVAGNVKNQKLMCSETVKKIRSKFNDEVNGLNSDYLLKNINIEKDADFGLDLQIFDIAKNDKMNANFAIYRMENFISQKNKEIQKYQDMAKQSIKDKKVDSAKSQLKISKMIESQKNRALISLEQLYNLKGKIEESENNGLVLGSLQTGKGVLKAINANMRDVENLVQELNDEVQQVNDISGLLGKNLEEENPALENELDEELKKMENEPVEMKQVLKQLESLNVNETELKQNCKETLNSGDKSEKELADNGKPVAIPN